MTERSKDPQRADSIILELGELSDKWGRQVDQLHTVNRKILLLKEDYNKLIKSTKKISKKILIISGYLEQLEPSERESIDSKSLAKICLQLDEVNSKIKELSNHGDNPPDL